MFLMIEYGIGGRMTEATHRYAEANNEHLPDYNPTKPSNHRMYLDANNLYGNSSASRTVTI